MHNRSLIEKIPIEYPDWIVTVVFYTALHAVDALLAHDKLTVQSHGARLSTLDGTNRYLAIRKNFRALYTLSRTVRYLADQQQWIVGSQIRDRVIPLLNEVEKSVGRLIGSGTLPLITLKS